MYSLAVGKGRLKGEKLIKLRRKNVGKAGKREGGGIMGGNKDKGLREMIILVNPTRSVLSSFLASQEYPGSRLHQNVTVALFITKLKPIQIRNEPTEDGLSFYRHRASKRLQMIP